MTTELVINGKSTTPTKHSIVGYQINGCEQIGDSITKLELVSAPSKKEESNRGTMWTKLSDKKPPVGTCKKNLLILWTKDSDSEGYEIGFFDDNYVYRIEDVEYWILLSELLKPPSEEDTEVPNSKGDSIDELIEWVNEKKKLYESRDPSAHDPWDAGISTFIQDLMPLLLKHKNS